MFSAESQRLTQSSSVLLFVCFILSQDEDEAHIVLSVKWISVKWSSVEPDDEPQKVKRLESRLQKMLQSWINKRKSMTECSVKRTLNDGRVVISIKPAAGAVKSYIII